MTRLPLIAAILLCGCTLPAQPRQQQQPRALPATDWTCPGDCLAVHDGDTIYARLYLDDETDRRCWLRLRGVFAPELGKPGGAEATAKLAAIVPVGSRITVRRWPVRSGKRWPVLLKSFDRYIADVTTEGGVAVNEAVQTQKTSRSD